MPLLTEINGQKIDVDWGLAELERLDCEESLAHFLREGWRFIDSAPFVDGWVIDAICEHLEAVCDGQIKRLLINIPPRCLKSSLCSVAFPAWVWAQRHVSPTSGPRVPFLHASYGHNLSIRDSVKCRRLIKSTWYRRLWGERFDIVKEQDQKIRFRNSVDGERLITSIGSGVTGEGGQIIIVDDPNAADEALSDAVTKVTNEDWWDGTMNTRLNDPKTGAFIVIQQRLSEKDLTGHIQQKDQGIGAWTQLILPMEYEKKRAVDLYPTKIGWIDPREEDGDLLWPERFGRPEVDNLKNELKEWRSAGQLQQRPEPLGGGIIKRKLWQVWPPEGEDIDPETGRIKDVADYPPIDYVLASLDTAYTERTFNDPSAMTVWGIFAGAPVAQDVVMSPRSRDNEESRVTMRVYSRTSPRVILMDAWEEWLDFHKLLGRVAQTCARWKVDKLIIENKASGISIAQEVRRLMTEGTVQDDTTRDLFKRAYSVQIVDPKNVDKVSRLFSIQHLFEDGLIYAPERPWSDLVINQCGTFPNAQHDDLVDTTSAALRHLREMGMLERGLEVTAALNADLRWRGRAPNKLYPV